MHIPIPFYCAEDSLLRKGEVKRRRPVGAMETITSGKKKDPREAEERRKKRDCRGKEASRRSQGGRKGQGEKGKFTPRGKCPNRSTALLCRRRHRHRRPFKSFSLFGSVSARISESADLPCRLSVSRGCVIFSEDLSYFSAARPHYNKS